jgi:hypothetical protein
MNNIATTNTKYFIVDRQLAADFSSAPVVEVWLTAEVEEEAPVTEEDPVGDEVVVSAGELEDAVETVEPLEVPPVEGEDVDEPVADELLEDVDPVTDAEEEVEADEVEAEVVEAEVVDEVVDEVAEVEEVVQLPVHQFREV